MNNDGYLVKFKNYEKVAEGTDKLHNEILIEKGKCLWGQWSITKNLMSENTLNRLNKETPFNLYALDNNYALLKMRVERVLTKEEIINEKLEHLIPSYYSINTPCCNYYLITSLETLPVGYSNSLITTNGKSAFKAKQINSTSPWKVSWKDEKILVNVKIPNEKLIKEQLYSATKSFAEGLRIWNEFDTNMYKVGFDLEFHPVSELCNLFENVIWDLIVEYRGYPDLHEEEQNLFKEIVCEFLDDENSSFKTIEEIVNAFLIPDFVINEFDLYNDFI